MQTAGLDVKKRAKMPPWLARGDKKLEMTGPEDNTKYSSVGIVQGADRSHYRFYFLLMLGIGPTTDPFFSLYWR